MTDKIKNPPKRAPLFFLKLALSIALLGCALNYIDFATFKEIVAGARVSDLTLASVVLCCGAFAGGASWYYVIRANAINVSYQRIVAMHWRGMFFNSFLPSNIGGDLYKGWMLVTDQRCGVATAAVSIVVDRALNFATLILIGLVAFASVLGKPALAAAIIALAVFASVTIVLIAHHWQPRAREAKLIRFLRELLAFFRAPRRCVFALCAAALSQSCKIGCHVFVISALGLNIDPICVWYVIPLFGIVSALPVSIGGLGVRESVAVLIAGAAGAAAEEMVALSLTSHLLVVLVNSLGVISFLPRRTGESRRGELSPRTQSGERHRPSGE